MKMDNYLLINEGCSNVPNPTLLLFNGGWGHTVYISDPKKTYIYDFWRSAVNGSDSCVGFQFVHNNYYLTYLLILQNYTSTKILLN